MIITWISILLSERKYEGQSLDLVPIASHSYVTCPVNITMTRPIEYNNDLHTVWSDLRAPAILYGKYRWVPQLEAAKA